MRPSIRRFRVWRRSTQVGIFLLLIASPLLDIFRLDVGALRLVFFGRSFGLESVFLLFLSFATLVGLFAFLANAVGKVFCGWVCPQNLLIEWAHTWLERWRLSRWTFYAVTAIGSAAGAFVVASYLVSPEVLVRAVARPSRAALAPLVFYLFVAALLFADVAFLRLGLCKIACPLGALQTLLASPRAWRIRVTPVAGACRSCTACAYACPVRIEPRKPDLRQCTTCGVCVAACEDVSTDRGHPVVLSLVPGTGPDLRRGLTARPRG